MSAPEPLVLPRGPRWGDLLTVDIERIGDKGVGLAYLDALVGPQREPKHYLVEVRNAVPGDRVVARVSKVRKRRIHTTIDTLERPSELRVEPRCRHFGSIAEEGRGCGGCTLQSLPYERQLAFKGQHVAELIAKAGLDAEVVSPAVGMPDPWHYRNKMEYGFGDDGERRFALGLHPAGYRYEVLDLSECWLLSPFASALLPRLRAWAAEHGLEHFDARRNLGFLRTLTIREGKRTGERLVELTTADADVAAFDGRPTSGELIARRLCDHLLSVAAELDGAVTSVWWTRHRAVAGEPTTLDERLLAGEAVLHEELHLRGGEVLRFEIHPRAFFQPNTLGAEILYGTVLDACGIGDGSGRVEHVLDLYCGTGTIGLCLAPWARRVTGVELQPDAVENARHNAALNGFDHVSFHAGDVGEVLAREGLEATSDLVVVDPPRAGLMSAAREILAATAAARLVYVSCNPANLARDAAALAEAGWRLEQVRPVDMFPHTYHVESVALLTRAKAAGA